MRELSYGVPGRSTNLRTFAVDDPSYGGAAHQYRIYEPFEGDCPGGLNMRDPLLGRVEFQKGPIASRADINGVQHEDLLAIVIDRLQSFQAGPYACADNQEALAHCASALEALQRRTRSRIARGVEGTHTV